MGQLLRATVDELEGALKESRQLSAARDQELQHSKQELERYKQQAARLCAGVERARRETADCLENRATKEPGITELQPSNKNRRKKEIQTLKSELDKYRGRLS